MVAIEPHMPLPSQLATPLFDFFFFRMPVRLGLPLYFGQQYDEAAKTI